MDPSPARTAALTGATLVAFAANSLLCRAALAPGLVDAVSFTGIRLACGAAALAVVARVVAGPPARAGSWLSALGLWAYAYAFSLAYVRIGAGVGALILFGAVQVTMIGWGLVRGERPRALEIVGVALALGGLVLLALPGVRGGVDPLGAALMAVAGVAWGVYSLRGRQAQRPIAANADNFLRSLVPAAAVGVACAGRAHLTWHGAALAATSGAVTSGLGYCMWYAALRGLSATRAAIVQLPVPVLSAAGAVLLLGESVTGRMVGAAAAILGGTAVAILAKVRA
jgi:drug/metabolite transporter (DMT)-like permease